MANVVKSRSLQKLDPEIKLTFFEFPDAPFKTKDALLGERSLISGASFLATDDWVRHLTIEGVNHSKKKVSYLCYALDFTIAGEEIPYRLRLVEGADLIKSDQIGATKISIFNGQKYSFSISDFTWEYSAKLISMINNGKVRIEKVELFLESVGFEDDTMWMCGSMLKRSKINPSTFGRDESLARNVDSIVTTSNFLLTKNMSTSSFASCHITEVTFSGTGGASQVSRILACAPDSHTGTCNTVKTGVVAGGGGTQGVSGTIDTPCS